MVEKLKALIVDDEESYRRFFKRSLERSASGTPEGNRLIF